MLYMVLPTSSNALSLPSDLIPMDALQTSPDMFKKQKETNDVLKKIDKIDLLY